MASIKIINKARIFNHLAAATLTLSIAACNENSNNNCSNASHQDSSKNVIEQQGVNNNNTISTNEIEKAPQTETNQVKHKNIKRYNDWNFFELRGKVKYVTTTYIHDINGKKSEDAITDTFCSNGFARFDKDLKIKRNTEKQIESISTYCDKIEPQWLTTKYTYNSDGSIASSQEELPQSSAKTTYFYDDKGYLTKTICVEQGVKEETTIITYKYLKFDAKDNWIKRTCTTTYIDDYDNSSTTNTETQTRKIIYY